MDINSKKTDIVHNSRELKKGEMKNILIDNFANILPDFKFLAYKSKSYVFQRLRIINNFTVYETCSVLFSLKSKCFDCSIASRLDKSLIFSNSYNLGLINPHDSLLFLKAGKNSLPLHEAYYFHNGLVETTTKIVKQILGDFEKIGLPFLERQAKNLEQDDIILFGLDYISNLKVDKSKLKEEIEVIYAQNEHVMSAINHSIYLDLKKKLQSFEERNAEDKKEIPKLTFELLQLYWTT